MEKTQREYYLNEQLKAIQKELGEIEDGKDESTSLNKAILKAKMPKEVEKKCLQELKKIKKYESNVSRSYSCQKLFRLDDRTYHGIKKVLLILI